MIEPDLASSDQLDAMDCAILAQRIKRAGRGDANNDGNLSRAEKETFCGKVALSEGERIDGGVTGSFLEFNGWGLFDSCQRCMGFCKADEDTFETNPEKEEKNQQKSATWGTIQYGEPIGQRDRAVVWFGTVYFKTGFGDVSTVEFTNDFRPGDILVNKKDIVSHALLLKKAAIMDGARGYHLWADKLTMPAFAELRGKLRLVASLGTGLNNAWTSMKGGSKVYSNISLARELLDEMDKSIEHFPSWLRNQVNDFDTNPSIQRRN
ncbi:unnamed protein product [Amoebophrya sp. A120]|nr:unnamed protein product [Amoebophrya sp. A120]|eukprot:GSA120T00000181001.1